MASLVIDLQMDSMDPNVRAADLLRKALAVSKKLNIDEMESWILCELNGYGEKEQCPDYRILSGQVRALNPVRGWIPVIFEDSEEGELFSRKRCSQAISELEGLMEKKETALMIPFPKSIERSICKNNMFDTEIALHISSTQIVGIIDAVRTRILDWGLKLEKEGVRGEGFIFSNEEKNIAARITYNINNFYGEVKESQFQHEASNSPQTINHAMMPMETIQSFLDLMKSSIDQIAIDMEARKELEAEIMTLRSQIQSPKPKVSIIKESLLSMKTILEGATGALVGELLKNIAPLVLK